MEGNSETKALQWLSSGQDRGAGPWEVLGNSDGVEDRGGMDPGVYPL